MAEKPKKVVEEYDSEEEEVNFTKSGYIEMKQKKNLETSILCFGWRFFVLLQERQ